MRQMFVPEYAITEDTALQDYCPWYAVAIAVEGGWICFESVIDARVWTDQQ